MGYFKMDYLVPNNPLNLSWHDLQKDSKDLPKWSGWFLCAIAILENNCIISSYTICDLYYDAEKNIWNAINTEKVEMFPVAGSVLLWTDIHPKDWVYIKYTSSKVIQ